VRERDVEQSEQPRMFPWSKLPLSADVAGNAVPSEHRAFVPELTNLALISRPRDAVDISDGFDLVIVPGVIAAREIEIVGNVRPELGSVFEAKGSDVTPTGQKGG